MTDEQRARDAPDADAANQLADVEQRLAKAIEGRQLAQTRAAKAHERAARVAVELGHVRRELASLKQSSSWRITAPLRVALHLLRGEPGAALAAAGVSADRLERLRRIAGREGGAAKRLARVAFYAAARCGARLPGSVALQRTLARWLPGPWERLQRRHAAQLDRVGETATPSLEAITMPWLTGDARYRQWIIEHEPAANDAGRQAPLSSAKGPVVAILIAAGAAERDAVARTISSLESQTSPAWTCLVAVSDHTGWHEALPTDDRVRMIVAAAVERGSALAALVQQTAAPCIAVLGAGDRLSATAIEDVVREFAAHPELDILYSDEDVMSPDGERRQPAFKPAWSPELFGAYNYFGRLTVLRRSRVEAVGGFASDLGPACEWDLNLRIADLSVNGAGRIGRIAKVLCHRAAAGPEHRPPSQDEAAGQFREALRRHWARQGIEASIETLANGTLRARWAIADPPLVSIIIPNKDKPDLLRVAVDGLRHSTDYPRLEIIIVDNDSTDTRTLGIYDELRTANAGQIVPFLEPFNYSAACNAGARAANGALLLFLNNDIEVTDADWLSELVRCATRPGVGVVGTRLVYPDGRLQHAGVVVGMHLCGLVFRGAEPGHDEPGYFKPGYWGVFGSPDTPRNALAIMGACQMVDRAVFDRLGGFDETYRISNSDVAFSLHAWKAGYRTVYTPFATLIHHEGATRGHTNPDEDLVRTAADIRALGLEDDPFFHPGLSSTLAIPTLRLGADNSSGVQARLDLARLLARYPLPTELELFDDADVQRAVGAPGGKCLPAAVAPDQIVDRWSAAGYCIGLLRDGPAIRSRFPRALSEGPDGAFARWLQGEGRAGVSRSALAEIDAVFRAPPGARPRQVYLMRRDLMDAMPLGLLPAGRRALFRWMFQHGAADLGLRTEEIWWFALECAENPAREFEQTYLMTPSWQRLFPLAMTRFDGSRFKRWLAAMHGLDADWARSFPAPPSCSRQPLSPAEQIRLAWQSRRAWQDRFPNAIDRPADAAALINWLSGTDGGLPDDQRAWCRGLDRHPTAQAIAAPGLNVVGHFSYPSGLRVSVEAIVNGLRTAGVSASLRDVPVGIATDDPIHDRFTGLGQYDVTLIHVEPEPLFPQAHALAGLAPREPRCYQIAYWYWELSRIPESWAHIAAATDEIWAATTFVSMALKSSLDTPVYTLPPGIELAPFERRPRAHFGIPEAKFVFLFVFHMTSVMERKNPIGLIRAFRRAFGRDAPVVLVIKTCFGERHPIEHAALGRAAGEAGVILIDATFTQDETLALMASCDAYVSLHRSEGLGLTMAEAMLLGKPTIATGFSGNVDFMNENNSLLVDYRIVQLERTMPPYEVGMEWAEPSEEHAARLMRRLYEDREFAAMLGARGKADVERTMSLAAAGRRMAERLAVIREARMRARDGRRRQGTYRRSE